MRGTQVLPLAPGTAPTSSGEVREAAPAPRSLVAIFEGKRYPVTKDRFLIGRGKETSDLLINEPSASRRHALVERIGSQYFLVDLESVNGVEYEGRKLLRKQIAEGDVFSFCGCRVRFTYEKNP
jgi:pSer/pThr/pTyr-binding forkhead associated (FHA) protein